jgi:hypothetical protein
LLIFKVDVDDDDDDDDGDGGGARGGVGGAFWVGASTLVVNKLLLLLLLLLLFWINFEGLEAIGAGGEWDEEEEIGRVVTCSSFRRTFDEDCWCGCAGASTLVVNKAGLTDDAGFKGFVSMTGASYCAVTTGVCLSNKLEVL